ncbi:hypothetical protein AB1N83_012688 [Pleurotus pulmonarius]
MKTRTLNQLYQRGPGDRLLHSRPVPKTTAVKTYNEWFLRLEPLASDPQQTTLFSVYQTEQYDVVLTLLAEWLQREAEAEERLKSLREGGIEAWSIHRLVTELSPRIVPGCV